MEEAISDRGVGRREAGSAGAPKVGIEIVSAPTVGFASAQNHVPAIRSISITNNGTQALKDVILRVSVDPPVATPVQFLYDRIEPGETRREAPVNVKFVFAELASRTETIRGRYEVEILQGSTGIAIASAGVELLAYDQWPGERSLPELLAAFSTPNTPIVDQYIARAGDLLKRDGFSMRGYQGESREEALYQVSALYNVLAAENFSYANPPASFTKEGQRIRTPERIAEGRVATCLDSTMLMASCLEQAGLNPVVLLGASHAWVACWLRKDRHPDPTIEDVQAIRKRIDAGEMIAVETTLITGGGSFKQACELGRSRLAFDDEHFLAIDVAAARERRILPLPHRQEAGNPTAAKPGDAPSAVRDVPTLPPEEPKAPADIEAKPDTPEGRIKLWENKLLDLSMRNRLLNFKPTNSSLQLMMTDPAAVEDKLAAGVEFKIEARPEFMEGADPRDQRLHDRNRGVDAWKELSKAAFDRNALLAKLEPEKLDNRLLEIFSNARTSMEEGGSNTLFIAFGFLKWGEKEKASKIHMAPLVLVPVTLKRASVRSGYRLCAHDDEALVNPTLLQLLARDFEIDVVGLDQLKRDDSGIDVAAALQAFRAATMHMEGWEVVDDTHLATFSFTKYLMWKDLRSRLDELRKNRVVAHLVDNPTGEYTGSSPVDGSKRLDEHYQPQDLIAPLLADSSQLTAIAHAAAGHDMVLDGPPGTGKSQTIANLIAHFLAAGKTVLFVSEKIAALNVVHDRLNKLGLGPFTLELHSAKSRKADVVNQLHQALNFVTSESAEHWEREAGRLKGLRDGLNELVHHLHREHENGLTAYDAAGVKILNTNWTPAFFPWEQPNVHDRAELDDLRELMKRIHALAGDFASLHRHPLEGIGRTEWSNRWEDDLYEAAAGLAAAIRELEGANAALLKATGFDMSQESTQALEAMDVLADVLMRAAAVPAGFARRAFEPDAAATLRAGMLHGSQRKAAWTSLAGFEPSIAGLDAKTVRTQWDAANAAWWPKSWADRRTVTAVLMQHRTDKARPARDEVAGLIDRLEVLNKEDAAIQSRANDLTSLVGDAFKGIDTQWESFRPWLAWAEDLDKAVAHLAGADLDRASETRAKVTTLLATHHRLLGAGQPLAGILATYRHRYTAFAAAARKVDELASGRTPVCGEPAAPGATQRAASAVERWAGSRRKIRAWCQWQAAREEAYSKGVDSIVGALERGMVTVSQVTDYFEFSYKTWWLKRLMDKEPVLRDFSSRMHETRIRDFRAADENFQKLTCAYVRAQVARKMPNAPQHASADSEVGKLRREAQRHVHMPVRQLLQQLPTLLTRIKPCLLMSPLSIAQYLDAAHHQFDVVIFDEASQIPVWDAVGAIARGKQLIVAGDPKQLPPTNFFQRSVTDDGDGDAEGDGQPVRDLESVLDECIAAGLPRHRLQWHYRSRHESLITFSNVTYYDQQLITFPSPVTLDQSVVFHPVMGAYERSGSRTNRGEADAIVDAIQKHFANQATRGKSVGVVTFNQAQQHLIESLLDARRREDPELDSAIASATYEPVFVKNLENVQGDERDVIMFSITYGPDGAGRVTGNYGPLTHEGGQRRLNVAITRAREKVYLYSTLKPEQIDLSRTGAKGVADLRNYLEFAIKGPRALLERSSPTGLEPESPFEIAVLRELRDKGWTVHPQVGCIGYRIDLGVVNPEASGEYLMGVECDGRTYHSGKTARDRDRLRQIVLEGLGWQLHRIWSTDWWIDAANEVERLDEALKRRLEEWKREKKESGGTPPASGPKVPEAPAPEAPKGGGGEGTASTMRPLSRPPSYPTYAIVQLRATRGEFDSPMSSGKIIEQFDQVIEGEGPVSEAVLFRRITQAWNVKRIGNRVEARLKELAPSRYSRSKDGTTAFYWPKGTERSSWRGFRGAGETEDSRRHIDEVCVEEIANIGEYLLRQGGRCSKTALAKDICRLVGMARSPEDAVRRATRGLEQLSASGRARDDGEFISPVL